MSYKFFLVCVLPMLLTHCASPATYAPEIGGPGARYSKGSILYSIPSNTPVLKMRLASVVQPEGKMMKVRMYFTSVEPRVNAYLDPNEQTISTPDSSVNILPTRIHASGVGKPMIRLVAAKHQLVELLFQTPKGGDEYPFIKLNWSVHYQQDGKAKVEAQTERFDFVDKSQPAEGVGQYSGSDQIDYGDWSVVPAVWFPEGNLWWYR